MYLSYSNKKSRDEIYNNIQECQLNYISGNKRSKSILVKGENLEVLKYLIEKFKLNGKIDLIYIDPPYSSSNTFFTSEEKSNTISRSESDNVAYSDTLKGPEHLEFIRERLFLLYELLSDIGSIYVHVDYKIGHYIKIIMDEIFGKKNFINEISRIKCNPKNFKRKGFGNIKDMILLYSKTSKPIWNQHYIPMNDSDINRLFKKINSEGRKYTTVPVHAPGETKKGKTGQEWRGMKPPKGRHWRSSPTELEYLDESGLIEWSKTGVPRKIIFADESKGKLIQDIIEYKDSQSPVYPTEKNSDLLDLLIKCSSNPDSYVLDCFCGSGTTLKSAHSLGRNFIGIDDSEEAIMVSLKKINNSNIDFKYLEVSK